MFFKDDDGAQAVLFGDGKVIVANFEIGVGEDFFAGVLLAEGIKNKIVTIDNNQDKDSGEINTKIRLCFQEIKSIDVLIDALKRAKKVIAQAEVTRILKPDLN
jgi:hypothetical protein